MKGPAIMMWTNSDEALHENKHSFNAELHVNYIIIFNLALGRLLENRLSTGFQACYVTDLVRHAHSASYG